jgi:5,10-methylenetetrahydromethanopterin reductase
MYPMQDIPKIAKRVEDYDFDEFHVADDLGFRPAWPILTLAAQATSTIRLGPFIVTPQLAHPAYHAANLAALDELSDGRAICGVGRGGLNSLLGIERPAKAITMLREGFELMEYVLAGERTGFDGEYFKALPELALQFEVRRKKMPMYIGTWGPRMSRMAGKVASGVKADCVANPGYLRELKDEMVAGAKDAGRDPDSVEMIVGPLCCISEDGAAAIRAMKEMLSFYLPFLQPMTRNEGIDEALIAHAAEAIGAGDADRAIELVPDSAVTAFSLSGTPADIIPRIRQLIDAGADNIAFGPPLGPDPDEALRLLGEQVLPSLR